MKLGRNLARTFLDYYKLTGFISAKPSSSLVPKMSGGGGGQTTQNGPGGASRSVRGENTGRFEPGSSRIQGDGNFNRKEDRMGRKSCDQNGRVGSCYSDLPSQQQNLFAGQPRDNRRL
ncbi:cytosolic carboxypeptidase 6-like isoform X2 [Elysia marginata]|uniref:Cytosolic carboxypeptidase 6-like isoform X2 n=1 Tax=Elysia marginata TaxID=1093978 RepID=A0AAV4JLQ1_9GAST|nr:cytosolic carboxypeptidase 6-like isoform X2 [Elysia marginata]